MSANPNQTKVIGTSIYAEMARTAADHVDRLEKQVEELLAERTELREALKPFSGLADRFPPGSYQTDNALLSLVTPDQTLPSAITFGELRRAADANKASPEAA